MLTQVLQDHIHSKPTAQFTADWDSFITLAKQHEVTAILYAQCKDFVPEPYLTDLQRYYSTVLFFYANRRTMMERIDEALHEIPHFTIKGAAVAQYYPYPAYRTMGDTDIVIHREDREEADRLLRGLGLECVSSFDDREWQYYRNDMEFELHDHLVYSETVNVDAQEQYFNDFWKFVKDGELDWNFHFMFLIFHLRKHFMNAGIGFRMFLDIAVLTSRGPEFDWNWIKTELETIGLWPFTERVFALNEYWFDVKPPIAISPLSSSFLTNATDLIEKNGIFGFDNEENAGNAAVNAARGAENKRIAMCQRALRGLFPSYRSVRAVPHYAYVDGRPYLLPVVWIHRAVRSIAKGRAGRNVKSVFNSSFADQATMEKREAIYREWGL